MGQQFHVVRCAACNIFQVQIIKKLNKWVCKRCDSKQSVVQVYGEGSGKDCRLHVQKLNALAYEKEECSSDEIYRSHTVIEHGIDEGEVKLNGGNITKWNKYLEPPQTGEPNKSAANKLNDFALSRGNESDFIVSDTNCYLPKTLHDNVCDIRSYNNFKNNLNGSKIQPDRNESNLFKFNGTDNDLDKMLSL